MARNRQRAKARKSKAREQVQSAGTRDALAPELRSTTEPPDPVAEASGDAEIAKAVEVVEAPEPQDVPEPDEALEAEGSGDELEAAAARITGRPGGESAGSGSALPKGGNRLFNFFRACWAELQRVQWPDRRQVAQATGVVLGFCLIAGSFLGLADYGMSKVVDAIL